MADVKVKVPHLEGALDEIVVAAVQAQLLGDQLGLHPREGQQVGERHVHGFLQQAERCVVRCVVMQGFSGLVSRWQEVMCCEWYLGCRVGPHEHLRVVLSTKCGEECHW